MVAVGDSSYVMAGVGWIWRWRMLQQDGLRARRGIRRGSRVAGNEARRRAMPSGRTGLGYRAGDATSAGGDGKGEKWRREQEVGSLQLMTEKRGWQPSVRWLAGWLAGTGTGRGKGPGRRPEGGESGCRPGKMQRCEWPAALGACPSAVRLVWADMRQCRCQCSARCRRLLLFSAQRLLLMTKSNGTVIDCALYAGTHRARRECSFGPRCRSIARCKAGSGPLLIG